RGTNTIPAGNTRQIRVLCISQVRTDGVGNDHSHCGDTADLAVSENGTGTVLAGVNEVLVGQKLRVLRRTDNKVAAILRNIANVQNGTSFNNLLIDLGTGSRRSELFRS